MKRAIVFMMLVTFCAGCANQRIYIDDTRNHWIPDGCEYIPAIGYPAMGSSRWRDYMGV